MANNNISDDTKEIIKQLSRLNYILEAAFHLTLTSTGYKKKKGKEDRQ